MENNMRVLVIFILSNISLFAQIDTSVWYPLDFGNYWEYQNEDGTWIETYTVLGDTIMPNGKTYAEIYGHYYPSGVSGFRFQRVEDNSYVYFYDSWSNTEYIFYDFAIAEDEYWDFGRSGHLRFLDYNSIIYSEIFGDTLNIKRFEEHKFMPDTIGFTYETIAKGIGLIVDAWYTGYEESDSITLVGAIINGQEYGQITSVKEEHAITIDYRLEQNYPNPFNPTTTIKYSILNQSFVQLNVYDILGNEVVALVNEEKVKGNYRIEFDASTLPSGIYFYRLQSNGFIKTKKLILLR